MDVIRPETDVMIEAAALSTDAGAEGVGAGVATTVSVGVEAEPWMRIRAVGVRATTHDDREATAVYQVHGVSAGRASYVASANWCNSSLAAPQGSGSHGLAELELDGAHNSSGGERIVTAPRRWFAFALVSVGWTAEAAPVWLGQ